MESEFIETIKKNFLHLNNQISIFEEKINSPIKNINLNILCGNLTKAKELLNYKEVIKEIQECFLFNDDNEISFYNPNYELKQEMQNLEQDFCQFKMSFQTNLKRVKKELKKVFDFEYNLKKEVIKPPDNLIKEIFDSNEKIKEPGKQTNFSLGKPIPENSESKFSEIKKINIKRQSFSYEGLTSEKLYKDLKEIKCYFCKGSSNEKELYTKLGRIYGPYEFKDQNYFFHEMCVLWSNGIEMDFNNCIENTLGMEIERTRNNRCAKCGEIGAGIECLDDDCHISYHFKCLISVSAVKLNYNKLSFYCLEHFHKPKNGNEQTSNGSRKEKIEKLLKNSKKIKKN